MYSVSLHFLSDKATQPYMTMAEVCAGFGVGQSTASAKARVISDALHTNRMDPGAKSVRDPGAQFTSPR